MSKKTEREMHLFRLGPVRAVDLRIKINKKLADRLGQIDGGKKAFGGHSIKIRRS